VKLVFYTGTESTYHSHAGVLKPGRNEVHRDHVADQLLAAGAITGDFLPGDAAARADIRRSSDGARWSEQLGEWVLELEATPEAAAATEAARGDANTAELKHAGGGAAGATKGPVKGTKKSGGRTRQGKE
jgi:hypothetical protein